MPSALAFAIAPLYLILRCDLKLFHVQLRSHVPQLAALQACNAAVSGEVPVTQWANEFGDLCKAMERLMEMYKPPFKNDAVIQRYMTNIVAHFFLACFEPVFSAAQAASSSIPVGYEKMVEEKQVQSLKNTMFSRKVHEASCGNLDSIVAATSCLQTSVKSCGHVLTATQLSKIKAHEGSVRTLRLYAATVHCCNLIIHKLHGKSLREKSALSREFLGIFYSGF